MGKAFSALSSYCPDSISTPIKDVYNRRKENRKRSLEFDEEAELMETLRSPKRMKMHCTSQYIYETLFVNGKDSDITVNILNKDWKLHKVYLCQSHYFKSMFSGAWKEGRDSYISIKVQDPRITEEALTIVFGSFYLDEVRMEPCSVVGVLAAATMFHMEGLVEQCFNMMLDALCPLTAVEYYQSACDYGFTEVKRKVLDWFAVNLTDYYSKSNKRLREIDINMMRDILSHPNLGVIQTEHSLYIILRKWLYLQLHPDEEVPDNASKLKFENYFRELDGKMPFLFTEEGQEYYQIFEKVRLYNLVLNLCDISTVIDDNIIPEKWLLEAYKKQWLTTLEVFNGYKGVTSKDEAYFLEHCYRCGRIVNKDDTLSWRWSGFSFGVDLIWTLHEHMVLIKRQRSQLDAGAPHNLLLKIEAVNLDEKKQTKKYADSGIMKITLARNQEIKALSLDKNFEFPIYLFVKLLLSDRGLRVRENT